MITAVLVHGFSGSPASWRRLTARLGSRAWAPALRGHAGAGVPAAGDDSGAAFSAEVERLARAIADNVPAPRFLVGYSLGGRIALGLLASRPDLFVGAVVVGANPGLPNDAERTVRRQEDETWARLIEEQGVEAFDREWSALPLFASQNRLDADLLAEQRRTRLGHEPRALAAAMRALSLGAMPDFRPVLPAVGCPVTLVAGGLDSKFVELAAQMAALLPAGRLEIVDGVGHNVPLEAPGRLARLVDRAISEADPEVSPSSFVRRRRTLRGVVSPAEGGVEDE